MLLSVVVHQVFLDKRIPVQGGLGGGSSNAATTLFAANQVNQWTAPPAGVVPFVVIVLTAVINLSP